MNALIDGDEDPLLTVLIRTCGKCGKIRPLGEFLKHLSCRFGRARICTPCDREYKRGYYTANIERKRAQANLLNRSKKEKAIALKGGKCSDCGGEFHRCCFDFHHEHGKDGNPSKFLTGSWERAKKELDKCVLLCANCHRMRHFMGDD